MITVELLDRVHQYDNTIQGAEDIISNIAEAVSSSGMILDSMDIDDSELYSDYGKYIMENIGSIKNIHVNLVTKDEFIEAIIDTTYSYIHAAVPKLHPIIDSLYTGDKSPQTISDLADLTEGITWMYSVGSEIIRDYKNNKSLASMLEIGYESDLQRLSEAFEELKSAIINMDYILIADILSYEISEIFNNILMYMKKIDSNKGSIKN